jgi:hypothetical protein
VLIEENPVTARAVAKHTASIGESQTRSCKNALNEMIFMVRASADKDGSEEKQLKIDKMILDEAIKSLGNRTCNYEHGYWSLPKYWSHPLP